MSLRMASATLDRIGGPLGRGHAGPGPVVERLTGGGHRPVDVGDLRLGHPPDQLLGGGRHHVECRGGGRLHPLPSDEQTIVRLHGPSLVGAGSAAAGPSEPGSSWGRAVAPAVSGQIVARVRAGTPRRSQSSLRSDRHRRARWTPTGSSGQRHRGTTMLSPLDDYPVHQISEPMRYVGTSDRNFYDRYYFNIHGTGEVHGTADELFAVIGVGPVPQPERGRCLRLGHVGRGPPGGPVLQDPRAPTGWTPRSGRSGSR